MLFLTKKVIYYKKTIKSNIKMYNICISLFLLSNIDPVLLSVHPMFVSCVKAFWWRGKIEISKNSLSWRSIATLAASKSAAIRATTSWQRRLSNARKFQAVIKPARRDAISIVCASDGEHESGIPYLKGLTTPPSYTNLPCRFRVAPSYPSSANPSSIWGALYITFVRSRRSPMCSRAD